MTGSNAQRLMLGCGVAALGAAAVFWVLSMAAANAGPKGPESPPAPAVAGGPAAGDLAQALGYVRESSVEEAEQ